MHSKWAVIKWLLWTYFDGGIFFIVFFYLFTARPSGYFAMTWNWLNVTLVVSYLLAYPALLWRFPKLRHGWTAKSYTTKAIENNQADHRGQHPDTANSTTHIFGTHSLLDSTTLTREAGLNGVAILVIDGFLILLAIPLWILILLWWGLRKIVRTIIQ